MGLQNINASSVEEGTKSEGALEKIVHTTEKNCQMKGSSFQKSGNATFTLVLEQIYHKSATFKYTPGHEYKTFPKFKRNTFQAIDKKSTHQWIKKHRQKWHRQNRFPYKFP